MAAVAIDMAREGFRVTGSDSQFYPPMSDLLRPSQVGLSHQFDPSNLPQIGLIVVGNAVSRGNVELEEALNLNLPLISLPELIRYHYLPGKRSLVVTGTHGKTTTTSMATHVYRTLGLEPGWMIGGDPVDLPFSCFKGDGDCFVIEGDEYDTAWFDKRPKFLLYRPYYAILTSIEFDHSDIYANIGEIEAVFRRFVGLLPASGSLVCYGDNGLVKEVTGSTRAKVITYGTTESCDWRIDDVTSEGASGAVGKVTSPDGRGYDLRLNVSGTHNLLNGLAVLAHAVEAGLDALEVLRALGSFQGVARRLQKIAEGGGVILYDDFAHHPTAIKTTLEAVRHRHPGATIKALFEPRSNTMVRNYFQRELEEALSIADRVMLGPLHRRDKIPPEQRLDVEKLVGNLKIKGIETTALDSLEGAADNIIDSLKPGDVVVAMSNGSFGGLTGELAGRINKRENQTNHR